jgi:HK97 family phage prohead protease
MIDHIERAAISARPEDIATKLRNAPAWVRSRHRTTQPPARVPDKSESRKPAKRSQAEVIGWIAGCCCPGVSRAAYAAHDRERLPEQFTPRAMEMILEQVRNVTKPVPLTWNHDGPVIAATDSIDLVFRMDRTVGLQFEARIRDTATGRKVLDEIDGRSLGVSIGFDKTKSWIVDRDGVGRMRVVDECVLHHVAVLPRSATLRPAYPAARCYGAKGAGMAAPRDLHERATAWAFREIAAQAGARRVGG